MKTKIFSLQIGELFILGNKKYKIIRDFYKNMPTIGRALNREVEDENGKIQLFTRNLEVEVSDK
jgi:hypothetical protein